MSDQGRPLGSAVGLWTFAESYLQAADHLVGGPSLRHNAPIYYLYSHSIELTLKAFLGGKGSTLVSLRKAGHRSSPVLVMARSKGFIETRGANYNDEALDLLDGLNREHEFRYIKTAAKTRPTLANLKAVTTALLSDTRDVCVGTIGSRQR